MESLNSIKETIDVSLLVFAPISLNLYLQVIAFHSPQNNVELFPTLLNLMLADTSLNITTRVLLLFMPSTAWVKSGTIDWQSAHLAVLRYPHAFQSHLSSGTLFRSQYSVCSSILLQSIKKYALP